MSERPLVSVVTATRSRPTEIRSCIDQVRSQTYRPLEHVIVSDGPDQPLRGHINTLQLAERESTLFLGEHGAPARPSGVPIVFAETGRLWSDELAFSKGAVPFLVAQFLASGPLQMWLSDDEEMDPQHIVSLVERLETTDSDFVYSPSWCWPVDRPEERTLIGVYPPVCGQITNALYRTTLLDYGTFLPHVGSGTDWYQVSHWLDAGARCAMTKTPTFWHRIDKIGDQHESRAKQPLRGLGGQREYLGQQWHGLHLDPQGNPRRSRTLLV